MTSRTDHKPPAAAELAELSALADGTLDPSRRGSVEAHIAASPELSALYERERRVVAAYAFVVTWLILKALNRFEQVRVPDDLELRGLDSEMGEEEAYVLT